VSEARPHRRGHAHDLRGCAKHRPRRAKNCVRLSCRLAPARELSDTGISANHKARISSRVVAALDLHRVREVKSTSSRRRSDEGTAATRAGGVGALARPALGSLDTSAAESHPRTENVLVSVLVMVPGVPVPGIRRYGLSVRVRLISIRVDALFTLGCAHRGCAFPKVPKVPSTGAPTYRHTDSP
jgi:hypothetical protein